MPYELYEGASGLDRVRESWQELESRSPVGLFQTYSFSRLWYDVVGADSGATPLVVLSSKDGAPQALLPACAVSYGPVRLLSWLGGPFVVGAGDVLCTHGMAPEQRHRFVCDSLPLARRRARTALLYLTNVREDAAAFPALSDHARVYKRSAAPYLPITGDYEGVIGSLARDVRHSVERRWRRLNEAGTVDFRILTGIEEGCREAAELLVELVKRRHDRPGERTELFDARYAAFRVAQACHDPNVRLATLSLDGVTIAAQQLYLFGDRMELAICGFDEAYAEFSPGRLLMRRLIQECFALGVQTLDLGEGADPYKYEWTSLETPLATFTSGDVPGRLLCTIAGSRKHLAEKTAG